MAGHEGAGYPGLKRGGGGLMPSIEEGELMGGREGRLLRLRDMGGSKRAASMARRRGEEERGRRSAGARKKKPVPRGPEGLVGWLGRVGRERVAWAGRQAKAG